MEGVTTALVAFILVCMVFPKIVQHKPQHYIAVFAVILVISLDALAHMTSGATGTTGPGGFASFLYVAIAVCQIAAFIMLILSSRGISGGELFSEMRGAYEVIRRGEDEKEIIIPLTGLQPKGKSAVDEVQAAINEEPTDPASHPRPSSSPLPLD